MSTPHPQRLDWDSIYAQDTPPAYSIGEPQPELAALIEDGKVRSEVLDAGCGHAALSLELAARGYTVVGLDGSGAAVAAAAAAAQDRGLRTASFAQADLTAFSGFNGRFNTIMDSGLLHVLTAEDGQDYLKCIHRAAAPGASLFILAFATQAFGDDTPPGPNGFTEDTLRQAVSAVWEVDELRPAKLYANETHLQGAGAAIGAAERDDRGRVKLPGFLVSAHKSR